jgi:HPt (histidine-containing phosphotransfer) domain-containing protein
MTAHVMPGDKERCLAGGMDGYLGKPIDPKALFAEVEEVLPAPTATPAAPAGLRASDTTERPAPTGAPSAPPSEPATPVIDRQDLLQRLHGNEQLAADVVRLFFGECPTMVDAVGTALAKRDIEQVRRAAHALRGSASTASAHGVASAARSLEKLATEGRIDGFDDAWVHLSKEASLLLQAPPPWAMSSGENSCEP